MSSARLSSAGDGAPVGTVLSGSWRVVDDRRGGPPAARVDRDLELGASVAAGGEGSVYRLWTNHRCLVATRREARLPGFPRAAARSAEAGWPVVVRDSGGTAIPHLPGTLHLTLALPRRADGDPTVEAVYRALGEPVRSVLSRLGVAASFGEVPRSFCDGRFNLVVGARKVAGTAQRWKGGIPGGGNAAGGFIFAHLSLFVEGDMAGATRALNRFLEWAGGEGGFEPGAAVTVDELLAAGTEPGVLVSRVREGLRDHLLRGTAS